MPLILASASPRRLELLRQIGVESEVCAAEIDETVQPGEAAGDYVLRLARQKAEKVYAENLAGQSELLCLGSDTSVVLNGQILGKPEHFAASRQMLQQLSGTKHQVMTAVALVGAFGVRQCLVTTDVWFRALTEEEIAAYWASGEPQDKAGSYGIQGLGAVFVDHIEGSYSAVVGLPLNETAQLLQAAGVPIWQRLQEIKEP